MEEEAQAAPVESIEESVSSDSPPTISKDMIDSGFSAPNAPVFEKINRPNNTYYLDERLKNDTSFKENVASNEEYLTEVFKKHNASQGLANEITNWVYKALEVVSKDQYDTKKAQTQADLARLNAENDLKKTRAAEAELAHDKEMDRQEQMRETKEWQNTKKFLERKVQVGDKSFDPKTLGNLMYNDTFVKVTSELYDLRRARDSNFIPTPQSPEERKAEHISLLRRLAGY